MPHAAAINAAGDGCPSDSTESQRMNSAEQAQLDVEANSTVQSSHTASHPAEDDALQGAQAIQQIVLHSSDGSSAAGSRVLSESDADDATPPREHEEPSYGDRVYWDQRYSKELAPGSTAPPHFDWYMGYTNSPLRGVLREHIPLAAPILQVGVGTSQLQREMVDDGYKLIVSTDTSVVAVEYMRALHADIPQLTYSVADCRAMPQYEDGAFAAVLDKGTLDAIVCGVAAEQDVQAMVAECYRVLEPGGVFIEISYGRPSRRLPYMSPGGAADWASVSVSGVRSSSAQEEKGALIRLPPLLGPYEASEAKLLDGIEVDSYYFCYVLRKPG